MIEKNEFQEAVELANKAFDVGARMAGTASDISNLSANFDSHKQDIYKRMDEAKQRIEGLPTKTEIELMFIKQGEKLAQGILKTIEANKEACDTKKEAIHKRLEKIETSATRQLGFIAGVSFAVSAVVASVAGLLKYKIIGGSGE